MAAAAHFLMEIDPDAVMLVLPADHVIDDGAAFHAAIARAAQLVARGALSRAAPSTAPPPHADDASRGVMRQRGKLAPDGFNRPATRCWRCA